MQGLKRSLKVSLFMAGVLVFLSGCQSTYYSAMEKVGYHKRDIMVDRIQDSQKAQENAQQQFRSALDQFQHTVSVDGGDLEAVYNDLNKEYQHSVDAADKVRSRIRSVVSVSEALFDEWEKELGQYTNSTLRRSSEQQLQTTRSRYQQMMDSMKRTEQQMQPVLDAFRDQVLFLKHNLNARAISALKGEFSGIRKDVDKLIRNMQQSIDYSNEFIASIKQP